MPTFPPLLPQLTVLSEVSATEASNTIRTAMDTGPAKVRRRSTAAPEIRSLGHPAYTAVQLRTFLNFYRDETYHGALAFNMWEPLFGVVRSFRFTAPPRWSPRGAGLYSVSAELEILP